MSYTDFAEYATEKIICFENANVSLIIKCAQKAAFGYTDIDYDELLSAIEAVKSIRASVLQVLTLPQKLLFIYFWHL